MKSRNHSDDVIVLILAARRNRARYMKVMFRKGIRALKSRLAHGIAQVRLAPTPRRVSHA